MLEKLKNLNLDRLLDLDDAVSLSAFSRSLAEEYLSLGIPVPEWLEKATNVLRAEIARRTHAADLAALKNLEAELESYRTVSERRTQAQQRMVDLQKKLGLSTAKAK